MPPQQPHHASFAARPVPEIDVDRLAELRASGVRVIDVREPDEYTAAHVPGAELIPLSTVPDSCDQISDRGTVYVICASGARSHRAAEYYRSRGIDAVNVAGGTVAWIEANLPIETGLQPPKST